VYGNNGGTFKGVRICWARKKVASKVAKDFMRHLEESEAKVHTANFYSLCGI